jgi:hypothetical protein
VKKYPLISKTLKTTLMVYSGSLQAMIKEVPGENNAEKFDTLCRYWYDNKDVTNWEYIWLHVLQAKVREEIDSDR